MIKFEGASLTNTYPEEVTVTPAQNGHIQKTIVIAMNECRPHSNIIIFQTRRKTNDYELEFISHFDDWLIIPSILKSKSAGSSCSLCLFAHFIVGNIFLHLTILIIIILYHICFDYEHFLEENRWNEISEDESNRNL